MFLVVLPLLNLVLDFVSLIAGTPWEALSPSIIVSGLVPSPLSATGGEEGIRYVTKGGVDRDRCG